MLMHSGTIKRDTLEFSKSTITKDIGKNIIEQDVKTYSHEKGTELLSSGVLSKVKLSMKQEFDAKSNHP